MPRPHGFRTVARAAAVAFLASTAAYTPPSTRAASWAARHDCGHLGVSRRWAWGSGSETLARAVIGGLTVPTFLTLFLVPSRQTPFARLSKPVVADGAEAGGANMEPAT